jgi:hypothetical protein
MTNRTHQRLVILAFATTLSGCGGGTSLSPTAPSTVLSTPSPPPPGSVAIPAVTVGKLSGEFTMTLTADVACDSLPNELRTRTYAATMTVNPYWHAPETYYDIWISGPAFLQGFDSAERFYVGATDDAASFGLGSRQGQPAFVEQLSPTAYFAIGGSALAALPASVTSFDAAMDGYLEYCVMKSAADAPVQGYSYGCASDAVLTRVRCESTKHRLHWDRR